MKAIITDIETSIALYHRFGWDGLNYHEKPIYEWQGRIDNLTAEQIAKGRKENPEARIFTIEEFRVMDNDEEYREYGDEFTARIWPTTESLGLFMHYQYPAYTSLPDDVDGKFVEVFIEFD